MSTGPTINRGGSKQDYETPQEFMNAVGKRFRGIEFDLAATEQNSKCGRSYFGLDKGIDSLKQSWNEIPGWLWLNPPFSDITPWAQKCAAEMELGAKILFLTPASVGSNWFQQWVRPSAHTLFLNGRIQFVGAADPYPKDLMLSVYAHGLTGDSIWKWK